MDAAKRHSETRRILVIDDSALARLLARSTFEKEGYAVMEAEDGASGLEMVRSQAPDCVVLDLLMPGKTGQDVLREMKRAQPGVPVIVVTADVQETTRTTCVELGASMVLNKPRHTEELVNAIRSVLGEGK